MNIENMKKIKKEKKTRGSKTMENSLYVQLKPTHTHSHTHSPRFL